MIGSKLCLDLIHSAPRGFRGPQKCNVPHSAGPLCPSTDPARSTAMWPLVRLHLPSRPATPHHCLLAALPTRASRLRAPPAAARCVPPDCASESDASSLLSLLATPAVRDSLGTHISRLAAHTQREPEHSTPIPRPAEAPTSHFVVYAFIRACFQHLSLSPVSPAQLPTIILFSFTLWTRRRRAAEGEKKITFQRGVRPSAL